MDFNMGCEHTKWASLQGASSSSNGQFFLALCMYLLSHPGLLFDGFTRPVVDLSSGSTWVMQAWLQQPDRLSFSRSLKFGAQIMVFHQTMPVCFLRADAVARCAPIYLQRGVGVAPTARVGSLLYLYSFKGPANGVGNIQQIPVTVKTEISVPEISMFNLSPHGPAFHLCGDHTVLT
jgi:hypothetical protein